MSKTNKLSIIFGSAFIVFLLLYLIVINPFADGDEYNENQVDYDPTVGESVYLNNATMYDQYSQEELETITVKNTYEDELGKEKTEIYRFHRVQNKWYLYTYQRGIDSYESCDKDAHKVWYECTDCWAIVPLLSVDEEKLSSLRVAVGTTFYQSKITLDESAPDYEQQLAGYGIDENSSFFEFTATKSGIPTKKRVYIGNYDASMNNYYLNIEGTNRIYVAKGTTSVLFEPAEYYVSATVSAVAESYANYYMNNFSIYNGTKIYHKILPTDENPTPTQETVKAGDIVEIYYSVSGGKDEEKIYALVDTADEAVAESLRLALIGSEAGAELKNVSVVYPRDYDEKIFTTGNFSWTNYLWYTTTGNYTAYEGGSDYRKDEYASTSVSYDIRIDSIIRSNSEVVKINWKNQSDRAPFYKYSTYVAAGASKDDIINTSNFFEIVEAFEAIEGSEVVSLSMTPEEILAYGLDAYTVYYKTPSGIMTADDNSDAMDILTYKYKENALFISEKQNDGTRYVGSWYYGAIYKVDDADTFFFLDWDKFSFIESNIFSVEIKYINKIKLEFNYADTGHKTYEITLHHTLSEDDPDSYTTVVQVNGKTVDTSNHAQLYMFLSTLGYEGMFGSDLESEVGKTAQEIIDGGKWTARLTFTLNAYAGEAYNGEELSVTFYPFSSPTYPQRYVMAKSPNGDSFTVLSSKLETLYIQVNKLVNGEKIDSTDKYE